MRLPKWLMLSMTVPLLWGLWGALTEIPEKRLNPPFPPTLGYVVWSLTMIPVCVIALRKINWRLTRSGRSIFYGCAVGFSGAAGQLLLFRVVNQGPAYLIFPIVCLPPLSPLCFHGHFYVSAPIHWRFPAFCSFCQRVFSFLCRSPPTVPSMEASGCCGPSPSFSCGLAGLLHEVVGQCHECRGAFRLHDGNRAGVESSGPGDGARHPRRLRDRVRNHLRDSMAERGRLPALCLCRSVWESDRGRAHGERYVSPRHYCRLVADLPTDARQIQFGRNGAGLGRGTFHGIR